MAIIFRTADTSKWGSGKGANLVPAEVDENFWELLERLTSLENNPPEAVSIESFTVTGDQMYVHMTDNSVMGPYTLPVAQWYPRGEWQPNTGYTRYDVVAENGAAYLVNWDHTSGSTFDPAANDGAGHDYYVVILVEPSNVLPAGGATGQVLTKIDATDFNVEWADPTGGVAPSGPVIYDVHGYAPGPVAANTMFYFVTGRPLILPAGAVGSYANLGTAPSGGDQYIYVADATGAIIFTFHFVDGLAYPQITNAPAADKTIAQGTVITVLADTVVAPAADLAVTLSFQIPAAVVLQGQPRTASTVYDVSCYVPGPCASDAVLFYFVAGRDLIAPADVTSMAAYLATAPVGGRQTVYIDKDGGTTGLYTLTFLAGSQVGQITGPASDINIYADDVIRVTTVGTSNASAADLAVTMSFLIPAP